MRALKRIGKVVLTALLVLVMTALIAIDTPWFHAWVRGKAEQAANGVLRGELSIGRLSGNLLTGVDLEHVVLRGESGPVFAADRVTVDYSLFDLIGNRIALSDVRIVHAEISLIETPAGWNVASLLTPRAPGAGPSTRSFAIDDLEIVDGRISIAPLHQDAGGARIPRTLASIEGRVGFSYAPGGLSLSANHLAFEARNPSLTVRNLSGALARTAEGWTFDGLTVETAASRIRADGRYSPGENPASVDLRIDTDPVSFAELSGVVPALGRYALSPVIHADLHGPVGAIDTHLQVADPAAGRVDARLVLDVDGPAQGVRGSATTTGLDAAPILGEDRWKTALTTTIDVDLRTTDGWTVHALSGDVTIAGAAVDALGYHADHLRVAGTLDAGTLKAEAALSAYGASAAANTTVDLVAEPPTYAATGRVRGLNLRALPARLGAPRLDSRVNGRYSVDGDGPRVRGTFDFDGSTIEGAEVGAGASSQFALGGDPPTYAFDGNVTHVDLERIGRAMRLTALADPRLASDLTGHVAVEGSGTAGASLQLQARGQLASSRVLGADVPSLAFTADLADNRLQLTANGEVRGLDLGRAAADRVTGRVNATFDVSGAMAPIDDPFHADAITAGGRLTLRDSTVDDVAVDHAELDATYADRVADVRTLDVEGPTVTLKASGALSLAERRASALDYTADLADLDVLSRLVGQRLTGSAHVEGRVTGDRRRLAAKGPVRLTRFVYEDVVNTLTAEGQYEIAVPDLDPSRMSVHAAVDSTLLTLEGRALTSASATVDYTRPDLTFDATLRDGARTARAAGRAVLETGRQQVHVDRLSLGTPTVTWSNPSGQAIDVDYGGGVVTLHKVTLAAGMQRLLADGALAVGDGRQGRLSVELENVDLAELSELLLLDRRLKGRLDATAMVTGGPATRQVTGNAKVQNGAVDEFAFDSLNAAVHYTPPRAQIDATLVQRPGSTLQITGGVPIGGDGALDLHVSSTPIDLAVLRAATTALQDVTGSLEINADVAGTLNAPAVTGDVRIVDGAFGVAATGVNYRDLQAVVRFAGDSATVEQLHILDHGGHPLTVTGRFGVEGRSIGDITVKAEGQGFHVLDNEFGDVALDTGLTLDGTLGSPHVSGTLRVDSGRIEVATLLARVTANPYDTRPASRADAPPQAGPYANLAMDLAIQVPDDLVLRGNGIAAAGGPSLGDLNATVGGTVRLVKDPRGQLRVLGTVNTVRGTYQFQGRQLNVVRNGTITFRGGETIDPALDVTTEREVSGVLVRVTIQGTAREPSLTLTSDPPMGETDILSLLVFNQPANQLGAGQRASLGDRAAALASAAVIGAISQSLEQALNLTVFELQTVSEAGGAPMVTIGKQVTERLFIRLRQLFGAQQVSRLMLEYELNRFLRLQGEVSDGQALANRSLTRRVERGGLDLVLFLRVLARAPGEAQLLLLPRQRRGLCSRRPESIRHCSTSGDCFWSTPMCR